MTSNLLLSPLNSWHTDHAGKMVEFGGWSMPVMYGSIVDEHKATREQMALFDVSHMGRLRFEGAGAVAFLDRVSTRRVTDLPNGRVRYSLLCNEAGGVLDDVLVYRLEEEQQTYYWLVVNASNRNKVINWFEQQQSPGEPVEMVDVTSQTAMIAVQGPQAMGVLKTLIDFPVDQLGYYRAKAGSVAGVKGMISRTGYTGEDGCELTVPAESAIDVWQAVLDAGQSLGAVAAGLGARDTLRLEAGMPLYGQEISETIGPVQAGLMMAANLKDRNFIGRQAIVDSQGDANLPQRVGLELSSRRVPRSHCPVHAGSDMVGEVTSGTFSPTFGKPLAMAYVKPEFTAVGTELLVDIRGNQEPAKVVELPFYKRPKK